MCGRYNIAPSQKVPTIRESSKSRRCLPAQVGVNHRVRNIPMSHVALYSHRVVSVVGKLEAARVPEHVWMDGEGERGSLAHAGQHLKKSAGETGAPRSDRKTYGEKRVSQRSCRSSSWRRGWVLGMPSLRGRRAGGLA
ncbi:protein of unknown function (plasmid) [Candidatus Methylocalor cossyra]|uniref:Abasic site processing protein n=1 Tax=Candidatus Methylocalor cossyra TaxID=3108543 RepID=A0ABM9NN69_9GAMM